MTDAPEFSPADERKPDPSEPYRYVCPECNGQVQGKNQTDRFRCSTCGATWEKLELRDRSA